MNETMTRDHTETGLGSLALAQNSEYNFGGDTGWGPLRQHYNLDFYAAFKMFLNHVHLYGFILRPSLQGKLVLLVE